MQRLAAVAALAAACVACSRNPNEAYQATHQPNILLITIDTWRADRLRPDVTPNLSALAATGVTFANARAAVPLTLPSHTTIFTGVLPPAHGVRENGIPLAETHPTVARLLKDRGYQTAAFVGAFVLDRRFGLARGFDVYDDRIPRDPNATERLDAERSASAVVDAALEWLAHRSAPGTPPPAPSPQRAAPFFVWLHLYDPHAPYVDHDRQAAGDHERYDGEVSYVDAQVARLFAHLREAQLWESTTVIVAGDHGEGLGEHDERTHGMLLYDSTLHVPLFVAGSGQKPGRRNDPVSLLDIAPTILGIGGNRKSRDMTGRDLLDATTGIGGKNASFRDIYAETEYPQVAGWSPLQALTDGRWKAIRAGHHTEMYDLSRDPDELKDVAAAQQSTVNAMAARIDTIRTSTPQVTTTISAEAQERLRALGYVAISGPPTPGDAAPNPSAQIAAWNAFEAALTALTNRDANSARTALKQLAERYPDAPVFQATYARAVKESGNAASALALYRVAAKRWPTDASLLHDLAVAAREAGELDEARKADQAALALRPSSGIARNGLGLLAIDQGRPQDAVREFAQATELDPNNASYCVNLGNAKHASGDPTGAENAYKKALEVDPRSADAANGLGVLLVEAKRPAEAVSWFERAITEQAAFVQAQLNLGIALQQSGDPKRAAEQYRAILDNPKAAARERTAARNLLSALGSAR